MYWPAELKRPFVRWPYLYFMLDLGWVHFRTTLMYRCYNKDIFEYIALDWKIFKWHGSFKLYDTDRRLSG